MAIILRPDKNEVSVTEPSSTIRIVAQPSSVAVIKDGPPGPPGPTVVSSDADNAAVLGTDGFIFVPPGGGGGEPGTMDHSKLLNLDKDDHLQYALADGSRGAFEGSGAVAAHEGAADPHTGYQLRTERGAADGYASLDFGAKVPVGELPVGTDAVSVAQGDHNHDGVYAPASPGLVVVADLADVPPGTPEGTVIILRGGA